MIEGNEAENDQPASLSIDHQEYWKAATNRILKSCHTSCPLLDAY